MLSQRCIGAVRVAGDDCLEDAPVIVDQIRLHRRERLHELAAIAMHMSQQARHRIMQDRQGLRM